jgi:SWI/SNF-related matrix-associated actin-dependent regulator of chromatin subfamily A3
MRVRSLFSDRVFTATTNIVVAHVIRNASTKQFRAVVALQSFIRWGLTGTPIQNSLDDLGSLMKFLKLPILEEHAQFKRHITGPIERGTSNTTRDFNNLRTLLSAVCLRRTKAVLSLAPVTEFTHWIDFTSAERIEYRHIERTCREALDLAVSGHKVKEAHQNVLEILLQLRLFCNNGNVYHNPAIALPGNPQDATEIMSLLQQNDEAICSYCFCDVTSLTGSNTQDEVLITGCGRAICAECVSTAEGELSQDAPCPICHSVHTNDTVAATRIEEAISPVNYPSKVQALCEDIERHGGEGKW